MAMPCGLDRLDQVEQAVQRVEVGLHLRDLRADVAVDAHHLQPGQRGGAAVAGQRLVVGDAELVVLQAGGDVGVRAGVDVGVDAQAHLRRAARPPPPRCDSSSSSPSLSTLKQRTPACSARRISARVLPTPENTTRRGVAAGGEHALELAARDDVEAAAGPREGLQHGQAGVGLHRVAEQVRPAGQRALVGGQRVEHRALRVHVQRRAELARQRVERAAVEPKFGALARQVGRAGQAHREAGAEAAVAVAAAGSVSGPFWPQPPARHNSSHRVALRRQRGRAGRAATLDRRCSRMPRILSTMSSCPAATPLTDCRVPAPPAAGAGRDRGHRRPLAAGRRDRHRHPAHRRPARAGVSRRQHDRRQHRSRRCRSCGWPRAPAATTTATCRAAGSTRATAASSSRPCRATPARRAGERCAYAAGLKRTAAAVRPRQRRWRQRWNRSRMLLRSSLGGRRRQHVLQAQAADARAAG